MVLVESRKFTSSVKAEAYAHQLRKKLRMADIEYEVFVNKNVVEIYRKGNLHYEG